MKKLWQRCKDVIVHRILGVQDTQHRIAWGVFLGLVVGWTPTMGLQMMIYVAVAAICRANKVSGIPMVWITNPFTAVPVYYTAWLAGNITLNGWDADTSAGRELVEKMAAPEGGFLELAFWESVGESLLAMGGELWLGSLVMGVLTGAPAYVLTYWGVGAYRRRKLERSGTETASTE